MFESSGGVCVTLRFFAGHCAACRDCNVYLRGTLYVRRAWKAHFVEVSR